jgi:hypothetical protein
MPSTTQAHIVDAMCKSLGHEHRSIFRMAGLSPTVPMKLCKMIVLSLHRIYQETSRILPLRPPMTVEEKSDLIYQ